jgi:hypothetical protein
MADIPSDDPWPERAQAPRGIVSEGKATYAESAYASKAFD